MEFTKYLKSEWDVISQAPLSFITGAILVAVIVFALTRLIYTNRIETLNERIRLRDDEIDQYEKNTGTQSPDEAKQLIEELEQQIQSLDSRALKPKQIEKLIEVLSKKVGNVGIYREMLPANSIILVSQITEAFKNSNWKVYPSMGMSTNDPSHDNLIITAYQINSHLPEAELVKEAFELAHIPFEWKLLAPPEEIKNIPQPHINIYIH